MIAAVALLTALQAAGLFAVEAERLFVAAPGRRRGADRPRCAARGRGAPRARSSPPLVAAPGRAGRSLISRTRNAWLGALVGLAVLAVMRVPRRALGAGRGGRRSSSLMRPAPVMDRLTVTDASSRDRYYMWQAGIDMIREKPVFGQGPGA